MRDTSESRRSGRAAGALTVAAVVLGMWLAALSGCNGVDEAQTREMPRKALAAVVVAAVGKGEIVKTYRAVGTVAPSDLARIIPKVGGRIARIAVDEGDKVARGAVLMQLDTYEYEWNVRNMSAVAKQAGANVNKSKRDFERMHKLHATRAVSDQVFQDAKTAYEVARFTHDQVVASLNIARRNLKECTVTAPLAGVVSNVYLNEGELIAPTSQALALIIMQMDEVKVEADLPEEAYGYISVGNRSMVTVDAIQGETFNGLITMIYPTIDPASRTFKVTITLQNPALRLRAGMTARAEVIQKAREAAVYAPIEAFVPGEEGYFVYKVADEAVYKTEVVVGIEGDRVFEIVSGVAPGDRLVVEGLTGLRDGMAVKVTNAALVDQGDGDRGPTPPAACDDSSGIAAHMPLRVTAKD